MRSAFFAFACLSPASVAEDLVNVLDIRPQIEKKIVPEKQRALENAIVAIQTNLERSDVLDARKGKGENPLSKVLAALKAPILEEHMMDTTFDVSKLHENLPLHITSSLGKGNGILLERPDYVLTAGHVIHGRSSTADAYPAGTDIELRRLDAPLDGVEPDNIVRDDPAITNLNIDGHFVVIAGDDPGERPKTYAGVAIKISPELAQYMGGKVEEFVKQYEKSFMLLLPPGESKKDASDNRKASGMSGSSVHVMTAGAGTESSYKFAGIMWGAATFKDDVYKLSFDLGFFTGLDEMRKALKELGSTPREMPDGFQVNRPPAESEHLATSKAGLING